MVDQRVAESQRIFNYNYDISPPLLDDMGFNELKQMLVSSQGESFFSRMHTMRETIDFIEQRVVKALEYLIQSKSYYHF